MLKREGEVPIVPEEDQIKDSGIYPKGERGKLITKAEEEHLKEKTRERKAKKPSEKPTKKEPEKKKKSIREEIEETETIELPGPHILTFDTEIDLPEEVCVTRDRRGRIIIETECGYEKISSSEEGIK